MKASPDRPLASWLKLARLQFYLAPTLAVITGGVLASSFFSIPIDHWPLWLTLAGVLLVEFITVTTNEIVDLPTDKINLHAGTFTGGSRVLAENLLTEQDVRNGRKIAVGILICLTLILGTLRPDRSFPLFCLLVAGLLIGIGYSAPPLKLAYRGLGELAVAITHSAFVLLAGYLSQGGDWRVPRIWMVILPLFFAILPSIILGGYPDKEADEKVGKKTLIVRLGFRNTTILALACTVAAAGLHLLYVENIWKVISLIITLHCLLLCIALIRSLQSPRDGRIDGIIALALSYMLWFVLAPLL